MHGAEPTRFRCRALVAIITGRRSDSENENNASNVAGSPLPVFTSSQALPRERQQPSLIW